MAREDSISLHLASPTRGGGIEREVKLGAGPGFHLPAFESLEAGEAAPVESIRQETVYYDTQDLRLVRWHCSLRHRRGEGWTVKLPSRSDGDLLERPELHFEGPPGRPPAAATGLLRAYIRHSELVSVARLSTLRHRVRVRDQEGQQLAEVVDDEVTVLDGRRVAGRFRELEVELGAGPDSLLDELVARLRAAGAGHPESTSKLVRALGPPALRMPEVAGPELPSDPTAGEVVRRSIAESVARLMWQDPLVRAGGGDPEDVHQARVATRRLRSDLKLFESLLDPAWVGATRDELRWIAGELGAVRDAEVLRERLAKRARGLPAEDRRGAQRLVARLDDAVAEHRSRLLEAMDTSRYVDLIETLVAGAATPPLLREAEQPALEVLPALVVRPWRKLRRAGRELDAGSAAEALHQVRILAKRARYAAEAVAPVVGRPAASFAKAAARVQTVLGEHQDSVVAMAWLRGAAGAGARQAFVAGQLWALEAAAGQAARQAWPETWKALDRRRLREWLP